MKKTILILGVLVCLAAAHLVFAQSGEGVITYEVKINVHRNLPPEREAMKEMIPEFRTNNDQLFFNANESLYKPVEEEPEAEEHHGGGGMRMRFQRPRSETYLNQQEGIKLIQQEFMGKKYLIEDSIKVSPWKIGAETKTIHGYTCRKATYYNDERKQNIVAWYTDQLRPYLGPENFNTLPGAVLEIDINEGERTILVKNIELRPLRKNEIKVPAAGTKMTQPEYRKMVDEQMEKMRANGANIMIRN